MPRNKAGKKANRRETNRLFQLALKARKKLRKQRRHEAGVLTIKEQAEHGLAPIIPGKNYGSSLFDAAGPNDLTVDEALTAADEAAVVTEIGIDNPIMETVPDDGGPFGDRASRIVSPTEEEWEAICAEAKRRKKSRRLIAEQHGFALAVEGGDAKNRLCYDRQEQEVAA